MTIAPIETIAAKAKKHFDDVGSLQGFSASCRSGAHDGVIGLSVSTITAETSADEGGVILAYTLDVTLAGGKAGPTERGLSAQQIAELMDFLGGLRRAAARKAAARSNRPTNNKMSAARDAHASIG